MFTLSQALEVIKNKPEFSAKDKGGYTVIDYNLNNKETFIGSNDEETKILLNLRGTAFDNTTGKIIRLGFHKFMNVGENPELDSKMDFSHKHVITQKLDGSCLFPIKTSPHGLFVMGTRAGVTDISSLAETFMVGSGSVEYSEFIKCCLEVDTLPIFEFCSLDNRVVIEYKEPSLTLLGIRCMVSGVYIEYEAMKYVAGLFNVPVVKLYDSTNPEEFKTFLNHIAELKNDEGVVIRFEEGPQKGHMVKVKAEDYVKKHKAVDSIRWKHDLVSLIINGLIDDVLPILSDDKRKEVEEYQYKFVTGMYTLSAAIMEKYIYLSGIVNQKDFALRIADDPHKKFLFALRKGNQTITEIVTEYARKHCFNQASVKELEELLGIAS